ncbi:MAG: phosphatidate cytidylyltransferase [Anaerolineaceae bacterium]|nr:phosphatidate cytidylyltransferase [Anaerolineaceae bacterium]
MLSNNWLALAITLVLSLVWLRLNNLAAHRGWMSSSLSRKIIHMGTGPLYVLCWLLFNDQVGARYLAAIVPLGISFQLLLVGLGVVQDPSSVEAMSRSGKREEILRGPLYYGIVFVLLTVFFWKTSPAGIVALMLLCGGDGLADVLGSRIHSARLPWSPTKSWVGTGAMFLGGVIFSTVILAIFIRLGVFPGPVVGYVFPLLIISATGALVESLPFKDLDNVTVPFVAVALGSVLF